jgi:Icc-related predicted phosphoesterase
LAVVPVQVFGALGDIHGDFPSARGIMQRHPEVPFWLCVGDVADDHGNYEALPSPLYWIKGNNENFDTIASAAFPANLHFIPNAHVQTLDGTLRVAGLGGTFAPSWYETPPAELPHPRKGSAKATELADKRRHFVRVEVDACKALDSIDVFLTHEAPRPYFAGSGPRRNDAGKTPINEVLAAMKPRLHLFGHHHRFSDQERLGIRSVGVDLVGRSYLLIDRESLTFEVRNAIT